MIISKIKDQLTAECALSTLQVFFQRHVFRKFMDEGLYGLKSAAEDVVDTMIYRVDVKNGRPVEFTETRETFVELVCEDLVDTVITRGLAHTTSSIMNANLIIWNSRKNS